MLPYYFSVDLFRAQSNRKNQGITAPDSHNNNNHQQHTLTPAPRLQPPGATPPRQSCNGPARRPCCSRQTSAAPTQAHRPPSSAAPRGPAAARDGRGTGRRQRRPLAAAGPVPARAQAPTEAQSSCWTERGESEKGKRVVGCSGSPAERHTDPHTSPTLTSTHPRPGRTSPRAAPPATCTAACPLRASASSTLIHCHQSVWTTCLPPSIRRACPPRRAR